MGGLLFKIHESYRWVVAICDKELYGRRFLEGKKLLDLTGPFFDGEEMDSEKISSEIKRCVAEDATFNFIGEEAIALAKKLGMVEDRGVMRIEGIPFALVLL